MTCLFKVWCPILPLNSEFGVGAEFWRWIRSLALNPSLAPNSKLALNIRKCQATLTHQAISPVVHKCFKKLNISARTEMFTSAPWALWPWITETVWAVLEDIGFIIIDLTSFCGRKPFGAKYGVWRWIRVWRWIQSLALNTKVWRWI